MSDPLYLPRKDFTQDAPAHESNARALEAFGEQVQTDITTGTSALAAHEADTTNVHGITDSAALATDAEVATAVSNHEADTTNVHGITNTALLALMLTGKTFANLARYTATIDPANVGANSSDTQSFTLTGVAATDEVVGHQAPSLTHGMVIQKIDITTANTVRIRFSNLTGAGINEASGAWVFLVMRP